MKYTAIAVLTLFVTSPAWGTGNNDDGSQEQGQAQAQGQLQGQSQSSKNINVNSANSGSVSGSESTATGIGGQGGAGGSAHANNDLSNVANWRYQESERPVDSAYAPAIHPSRPCAISTSAALQTMDIGVSFGGDVLTLEECEKREAFRMGIDSGDPRVHNAAVAVYMNLDVVRDALAEPEDEGQAQQGRRDSAEVAAASDHLSLP